MTRFLQNVGDDVSELSVAFLLTTKRPLTMKVSCDRKVYFVVDGNFFVPSFFFFFLRRH